MFKKLGKALQLNKEQLFFCDLFYKLHIYFNNNCCKIPKHTSDMSAS